MYSIAFAYCILYLTMYSIIQQYTVSKNGKRLCIVLLSYSSNYIKFSRVYTTYFSVASLALNRYSIVLSFYRIVLCSIRYYVQYRAVGRLEFSRSDQSPALYVLLCFLYYIQGAAACYTWTALADRWLKSRSTVLILLCRRIQRLQNLKCSLLYTVPLNLVPMEVGISKMITIFQA